MAYSTTAGHEAQQMQLFSYSRFLRDSLYPELDSSIQEFAQVFAYILDLMSDEELAYLYSANTIGRTSYLPLSIYGIALYMHHSRRETVKDTLAAIRISPQLQKVLFLTSVPSEATMSKRVKELIGKIGQRRMAESICKDGIILNASIDSSICEAREKAINRKKEAASAGCVQEETAEVKAKTGRGRPRKGSAEEKAIAERRAAEAKAYEERRKRNIELSPDALLDELGLEMRCSWTAKTNSKGKRQWFRGYKIHILADDNGRIAAYHITGACVHDSRVAVYLMKRFANFCYALMDKAYGTREIEDFCNDAGHVAIIDRKSNQKVQLTERQKEIYKKRTTVERTNSSVKESFLPPRLRFRGRRFTFAIETAALLHNVKTTLALEKKRKAAA